MWAAIKLLIGVRVGLLILAFLAAFAGFLVLGIGNMISQADEHRLVQHNIGDAHKLRDWRLK
jgi:hypothetical protein